MIFTKEKGISKNLIQKTLSKANSRPLLIFNYQTQSSALSFEKNIFIRN